MLEFFRRGIENELVVDVAHAAGADRAAEGNAGDGERRRGADHRGDVRIDHRIGRENVNDDLHFIEEAVRESGRIGRSMRRAKSVADSGGLPSRLIKPPGILPTAYIFSSKSTVNGKKSTPSWVSGVTSNIDNPLLVASHMLP